MEVVKYPDERLRQKSAPVEKITRREIKFLSMMLSVMRLHKGIGIAAPQLGILKRLIAVDIGNGAVLLGNPRILQRKGGTILNEGCLSVPGVRVDIARPDYVVVAGLNDKNVNVEIKAEGLLARVLQHEIDHLDGKLIIDCMSLNREGYKG